MMNSLNVHAAAVMLLTASLFSPSIFGAELTQASTQVTPADLEQIHKTIDETVWREFKKAFESGDGKALNRLYAEKVLRVTPEGLDTSGAFKLANEMRQKIDSDSNRKVELDFWLDSRRSNASTSYQVGFFRVRSTDTEMKTQTHYGQFHIVLEKQQDGWKIVQDWDTDTIAGYPISAREFEQQAPQNF